MSDTPLISIIVPVYNVAPYSLSKQVNPHSFESSVWIQNKLAALFPQLYTEDYYTGKILRLQILELQIHANGFGWRGLRTVSEQIFRNADLRRGYLSATAVSSVYRFPGMCIRKNWKNGYLLWSALISMPNAIKYLLRRIANSLIKRR